MKATSVCIIYFIPFQTHTNLCWYKYSIYSSRRNLTLTQKLFQYVFLSPQGCKPRYCDYLSVFILCYKSKKSQMLDSTKIKRLFVSQFIFKWLHGSHHSSLPLLVWLAQEGYKDFSYIQKTALVRGHVLLSYYSIMQQFSK